jgi:Tfp pilus assembly protein PilV
MSTEKKKIVKQTTPSAYKHTTTAGFTLTEVMVAFAIFFIVLLGVLASFTYAVNYNAGNSSRAQALAILQQKVEVMRSKKYTPGFTDADLMGGTKTPETVTGSDGFKYVIK